MEVLFVRMLPRDEVDLRAMVPSVEQFKENEQDNYDDQQPAKREKYDV